MRPRPFSGVLLLGLVLAGACASPAPWRLVQPPWTPQAIGEREDARATLHDGSVIELENARIVLSPWGSYVSGDGEDDRRRRQVQLEDVHRLEARERRPERFSEYGGALQLILVVAVLILAGLIWSHAEVH